MLIQEQLKSEFLKADKIMLILVFVHYVFAGFISAIEYDTYILGNISGGALMLVTFVAYTFFKGERIFRVVVAIVLMAFSSIYIQQHLGRIEMHFHVFIAISFLSIYKDYLPTIIAGITTTLYHVVFNTLQEQNLSFFKEPIYIFSYGCGWDVVYLHLLFVVIEVIVITYFIIKSKEAYVNIISARNSYHVLSKTLENEVLKQTRSLTQLNELYVEAQEITHLGNWEWDIITNKLVWNDEIYRIYNLEPHAILPTYDTFMSYVHPDDRANVQQKVDDALKKDTPYDITHRLLLIDNSIKYVRERGRVYKDSDHRAVRMIGTIQEVTTEMQTRLLLEQSEKKFRMMSEHTFTGIFIYQDTFKYVNPAMEAIMGYTEEELLRKRPLDLIAVENRKVAEKNLERRLNGEIFKEEYPALTVIHKNGEKRIVSLHVTTIEYENGYAGLGTFVDITQMQKTQEELKTLSQVVEQTDDIVKITTHEGILTYVNDAFVSHTGFTRREVMGKSPKCLKSGEHDSAFYAELWKTILSGDVYRNVLTNRKKDGKTYYEEQTITPIVDQSGAIIAFVSTGKDITERKILENKLQEIAMKDKLTNAFNRHRFDELFLIEVERYQRFDTPFSLIMADIDYFKKINDAFGHDVGDLVLIEFTNIIQSNIRKMDVLFRWGGEEFIILCPQTSLSDAMRLAEKLRFIVESNPFEVAGNVTSSFGVSAMFEKDTKETILKRLDMALYSAKESGRNRIKEGIKV